MKLYVLDDNGEVVMEYSDTDGGEHQRQPGFIIKAKIIELLKAALELLQLKEK